MLCLQSKINLVLLSFTSENRISFYHFCLVLTNKNLIFTEWTTEPDVYKEATMFRHHLLNNASNKCYGHTVDSRNEPGSIGRT